LRIAVHLPLPEVEERIRSELSGAEIVHVPREGAIPENIRADILLTLGHRGDNTAEVIDACEGLRWIHVYGTGVENFPFESVGERMLTCSRGASAIPISEWVLAVMLAYEKRLPGSWITEPPEKWNQAELGSLYGKTLGLIGLGSIGQAVARRALAFDMKVIACVRQFRTSPVEGVEVIESMDEVLSRSDHLVLTLPSTAGNRHLFGDELFERVKPGAHLVNIARGNIVDQAALIKALDSGQISCASLDVVDPEPLPNGHSLYTHPGVRLSPHISWSYPEARIILQQNFIDNLKAYMAGTGLSGIVDIEAGY